ncbi:TetR/AcrR family transcriptional regulator [uncultured Ferrimonas sp.]|uniref:TetR/AcrR family transcriptional regulator n=1 Tax=uncultured Ferrimonas sp. TaxID=432640 RepID=UPI00261290BC|nr:TetR/AcrR family transcriptional regulator [uncultured Ferrimonas sp.]
MQNKLSRSEQKRQAIIAAAKTLFIASGIHATSMDQLAAEAQVSKRTVYNHFASKELLVAQLLTEMWQQSLLEINQPFVADAPLAPQLQRLLLAEVALFQRPEYMDLVRVAMAHFMFHPEQLQQAMVQLGKGDTALHHWLIAAMDSGQLQCTSVELAVTQLHSLIKGLYFWPTLIHLPSCDEANDSEFVVAESVAMFLGRYQRG